MFRTAIRFVAQVANLPVVKVPLAMACITAGVAVLTRHAGELRDDIDQLTDQRAHLRGEIVHLRARVVAEYTKQATAPTPPGGFKPAPAGATPGWQPDGTIVTEDGYHLTTAPADEENGDDELGETIARLTADV